MDKVQEISELLKEIKRKVEDLPAEIRIAANQINVTTLNEISESLGLIRAGELRVGTKDEPGKGFTGVRIRYPAMTYEGDTWHLVGVNNDVLQVGLSAEDGKLYAAGGKLIVDQDAMTLEGLLYAMTHEATVGANTRSAWLGMWTPSGASSPTWGIIFSGGTTGSNLVTNGGAELGSLTNWTQSGTAYSASTTSPNAGTYCFKCDAITSGTETLTSDRIAVAAGTKYDISCYTKDTIPETATNITATSITDVYLYQADANTNKDAYAFFSVGKDAAGLVRSVLKADFSAVPSYINEVVSSYLYLHQYNDLVQSSLSVHAYRLKRAWIENQATWNSWKTGSTWSTAGAFGSDDCEQTACSTSAITLSAGSGRAQWDSITLDNDLVKEMIDGTFTNNGWLLKETTEPALTYIQVDSSEETSNTPYVSLTYNIKPDYSISVKWYDDPSAGSLLRTDILSTENSVVTWNKQTIQAVAPASAQSCEIIISATSGAVFYVDDFDIHSIAISESMWFEDDSINTTTAFVAGTDTDAAELSKDYIQFPRLSETERDALASPAAGMVVWNTDDTQLQVFYDCDWHSLTASTGAV